MSRYYVTCPKCQKRMRRTDEKEQVGRSMDGVQFYDRKYECPNCGQTWSMIHH